MTSRQTRRRSQTGIGVDSSGAPVIDPTENVLSLVDVEKQHQKEIRDLQEVYDKAILNAETKRQDDMRERDLMWADKLAGMKERYDDKIFNIQTTQVKTTSDLISTQLSKETGSLAGQINAATLQTQGLISTLSGRIDRLEQSRYEIAGRTSISDPATAEAIARLTTLISSSNVNTGRQAGAKDVWGYIIGAIGLLLAVGSLVVLIVTRTHG